MRAWERAPIDTLCGGAHDGRDLVIIRKGEPTLVLTFVAFSRCLYRCERCAGEPVPADLPPLDEASEIKPSPLIREGRQPLPFGSFAGSAAEVLKLAARDHKMAAAGREPGEDG